MTERWTDKKKGFTSFSSGLLPNISGLSFSRSQREALGELFGTKVFQKDDKGEVIIRGHGLYEKVQIYPEEEASEGQLYFVNYRREADDKLYTAMCSISAAKVVVLKIWDQQEFFNLTTAIPVDADDASGESENTDRPYIVSKKVKLKQKHDMEKLPEEQVVKYVVWMPFTFDVPESTGNNFFDAKTYTGSTVYKYLWSGGTCILISPLGNINCDEDYLYWVEYDDDDERYEIWKYGYEEEQIPGTSPPEYRQVFRHITGDEGVGVSGATALVTSAGVEDTVYSEIDKTVLCASAHGFTFGGYLKTVTPSSSSVTVLSDKNVIGVYGPASRWARIWKKETSSSSSSEETVYWSFGTYLSVSNASAGVSTTYHMQAGYGCTAEEYASLDTFDQLPVLQDAEGNPLYAGWYDGVNTNYMVDFYIPIIIGDEGAISYTSIIENLAWTAAGASWSYALDLSISASKSQSSTTTTYGCGNEVYPAIWCPDGAKIFREVSTTYEYNGVIQHQGTITVVLPYGE